MYEVTEDLKGDDFDKLVWRQMGRETDEHTHPKLGIYKIISPDFKHVCRLAHYSKLRN